jgi:hypothetical protein
MGFDVIEKTNRWLRLVLRVAVIMAILLLGDNPPPILLGNLLYLECLSGLGVY